MRQGSANQGAVMASDETWVDIGAADVLSALP
jgi:hypothetical protein